MNLASFSVFSLFVLTALFESVLAQMLNRGRGGPIRKRRASARIYSECSFSGVFQKTIAVTVWVAVLRRRTSPRPGKLHLLRAHLHAGWKGDRVSSNWLLSRVKVSVTLREFTECAEASSCPKMRSSPPPLALSTPPSEMSITLFTSVKCLSSQVPSLIAPDINQFTSHKILSTAFQPLFEAFRPK